MIKAEVIAHEGNPGPNWLDQCRNLVSPGRTTAIVLILGLATLITLVMHNRAVAPTTDASQQNTPASGLTVQPLVNPNAASASTTLNLQSAGSNEPTTTNPEKGSTAADTLGAPSTPSLNNTKTPSTQQKPAATQQSQLNGKNLTNTVQTTVQEAPSSVSGALKGLGL